MTFILKTDRTVLREVTEADLDELAALLADEDQMRFYPATRSREEARAWIERNLRLYRELGYGFWLMEGSEDGTFLGYCGIRPLTLDGVEETEMGWHTRKQVWGKGFATEAALACRDLAFDRFGIGRLVATVDPAHEASRRVATKIGMRLEREAVLDGWPCVVYAVGKGTS